MNRSRLKNPLQCLALCLLGAGTIYVCHAVRFNAASKLAATSQPARTRASNPDQLRIAQSEIEQNIAQAQAALESVRQDAEKISARANEESKAWAQGAVTLGQNLLRAFEIKDADPKNNKELSSPTASDAQAQAAAEACPPKNDAPTDEPAKPTNFLADKKKVFVIAKRENIAQFQSRMLYGALELRDDQWRQVDRTLAAYYQEGFTRQLNGIARPQTGADDAWQQQRADLSRRAFADINARLTPEQATRFQKLCPGDKWLWAVEAAM